MFMTYINKGCFETLEQMFHIIVHLLISFLKWQVGQVMPGLPQLMNQETQRPPAAESAHKNLNIISYVGDHLKVTPGPSLLHGKILFNIKLDA